MAVLVAQVEMAQQKAEQAQVRSPAGEPERPAARIGTGRSGAEPLRADAHGQAGRFLGPEPGHPRGRHPGIPPDGRPVPPGLARRHRPTGDLTAGRPRPHRREPHRREPHRREPHRREPHRREPHRREPHRREPHRPEPPRLRPREPLPPPRPPPLSATIRPPAPGPPWPTPGPSWASPISGEAPGPIRSTARAWS